MQSYRFPTFDPWIDGNMTLAKRIVERVGLSDNFTLRSYPDQDDFC